MMETQIETKKWRRVISDNDEYQNLIGAHYYVIDIPANNEYVVFCDVAAGRNIYECEMTVCDNYEQAQQIADELNEVYESELFNMRVHDGFFLKEEGVAV